MSEKWSSRRDFILATTGAAVGLGNIWKFPYMVGEHGGSAFILVYLFCIAVIGIPLMMAEMLIGRHQEADPVTALQAITRESSYKLPLKPIAYLGICGLIIVLSFYCVLSGWSLAFFVRAICGTFHGANTGQVTAIFNEFLANPWEMIAFQSLFVVTTLMIVTKGIQAGLEKTSRLLMPMLFMILIILVIFALSTGAAKEAFIYLFQFNIHAINHQVILAAMGHSFFTLALGAGAILMYGAYAPKSIPLPSTVLIIAALDTVVALLAGLAIFPIVLQHGLAPNEGPGLMFVSLPTTFASMPGGDILAASFFLFLSIAALTSSINIAEPPIAVLVTRYQYTRKQAGLLIGMIVWVLGLGSIFSFNYTADAKFLGMSFFEWMTQIPDKFILPIGGITFALIVGYLLPKQLVRDSLPMQNGPYFNLWYGLIRYLTPLSIFIVMVTSYLL